SVDGVGAWRYPNKFNCRFVVPRLFRNRQSERCCATAAARKIYVGTRWIRYERYLGGIRTGYPRNCGARREGGATQHKHNPSHSTPQGYSDQTPEMQCPRSQRPGAMPFPFPMALSHASAVRRSVTFVTRSRFAKENRAQPMTAPRGSGQSTGAASRLAKSVLSTVQWTLAQSSSAPGSIISGRASPPKSRKPTLP